MCRGLNFTRSIIRTLAGMVSIIRVDSNTDNLWMTVLFMGGRVRMGVVLSRESCVVV